MKQALADQPEQPKTIPEGISSVLIDMKSGQQVEAPGPGIRLEYFIPGSEPSLQTEPERGTLVLEGDNTQELF